MGITLFEHVEPMLAEYSDLDLDELLESYGSHVFAEFKSDGYRCMVHADGQKVKMFSHGGQVFDQRFFTNTVEALKRKNLKETIIDSEILGADEGRFPAFKQIVDKFRYEGKMGEKTFQKEYVNTGELQRMIDIPVRLVVFDTLMYEGEDFTGAPLRERRKLTERMDSEVSKPSKLWICDSVQAIRDAYHEVVEVKKYEGLVLKNPNQNYLFGKRAWAKYKKFENIDMAVVGFYKDNISFSEDDPITGILVAILNGDHYETLGKVNVAKKDRLLGGRFSQEVYKALHGKERKTPPKNLSISPRMEKIGQKPVCYIDPLKSIVVEIKAMDIDRGYNNANSCGFDGKSAYSMRVSYVERIRDDKSVSQVSGIDLIEKLYKSSRQSNS